MESRLLPSRFGSSQNSNLLEYVLDSVWTVADDILVIFDEEPSLALVESIAPFGVKVVVDRDGGSILSRVLTGMRASASENCLVVSSSAPFVKPNVVFHLFQSIHGFDAAVPRWESGKLEPLLSVYSRKAMLKAASQRRKRTLESLVDDIYDVTFVGVEKFLKPLDPELHSFFRINGESDLKKARRIASSSTL